MITGKCDSNPRNLQVNETRFSTRSFKTCTKLTKIELKKKLEACVPVFFFLGVNIRIRDRIDLWVENLIRLRSDPK